MKKDLIQTAVNGNDARRCSRNQGIRVHAKEPMIFRLASLFVVCLVMASLLNTSIVMAEEEKIVLRFPIWSTNTSHLSLLNDIADNYTAQHPNITIKFESILVKDFRRTMMRRLEGSDPPDGSWLREIWAPEFIGAGALVDLRHTLEKYEKYDYNDFFKLELWKRGAAVYGVPFSTSPFLIAYNKEFFKKADAPTPAELLRSDNWTWKEFRKIAEIIKEKTGRYAYQTRGYQDPIYLLTPIIRAFGGEIWSDDGHCSINSPQAAEAVQFFYNMVFVDKSVVPPGNPSDFYKGEVAMKYDQLSRVASKLENVSWQWDIAPLPKGPAGEVSLIGQAAVVVYKASKHKNIAMDFVAFMTTPRNVLKMSEFFPPARKSIINSKDFPLEIPSIPAQNVRLAVVESLEKGEVLLSHKKYSRLDSIAREQFDGLWDKDKDVKRVLENTCRELNRFLK